MSTTNKRPWELPGYSDIVRAAVEHDAVEVRFANGDVVRVSPALFGVSVDGLAVEPGGEGSSLSVSSSEAPSRDLDWMVIRSATDPAFADELRERDAEESRRIGRRLKALREDRRLSQGEVARMAGMPAPQLSKLEKGETDMRLSTVRSLLRAMGSSFADISGPDVPEVSTKELQKRARSAGVPKEVAARFTELIDRRELPEALERAFRWPQHALLAGVPESSPLDVQVQFKAPSPSDARSSPLLHLARSVSTLAASRHRASLREIPADPLGLRSEVLDTYGEVTPGALLRWTWDAGVVVVPLKGSGSFVALVWLVEGRPVVVLKEPRQLGVYWLFDLAHELGHLALGHVVDHAIVDLSAPWQQQDVDEQEQEANDYALTLLLGGYRALLEDVRRRTAGDYMKFKFAVRDVATQAGVSPGLLGLAAAHEMPDVGEPKDTWGSATNLAKVEGVGREVAEKLFADRIRAMDPNSLDDAIIRVVTSS